jgi:hypothetical protein
MALVTGVVAIDRDLSHSVSAIKRMVLQYLCGILSMTLRPRYTAIGLVDTVMWTRSFSPGVGLGYQGYTGAPEAESRSIPTDTQYLRGGG